MSEQTGSRGGLPSLRQGKAGKAPAHQPAFRVTGFGSRLLNHPMSKKDLFYPWNPGPHSTRPHPSPHRPPPTHPSVATNRLSPPTSCYSSSTGCVDQTAGVIPVLPISCTRTPAHRLHIQVTSPWAPKSCLAAYLPMSASQSPPSPGDTTAHLTWPPGPTFCPAPICSPPSSQNKPLQSDATQ